METSPGVGKVSGQRLCSTFGGPAILMHQDPWLCAARLPGLCLCREETSAVYRVCRTQRARRGAVYLTSTELPISDGTHGPRPVVRSGPGIAARFHGSVTLRTFHGCLPTVAIRRQ